MLGADASNFYFHIIANLFKETKLENCMRE